MECLGSLYHEVFPSYHYVTQFYSVQQLRLTIMVLEIWNALLQATLIHKASIEKSDVILGGFPLYVSFFFSSSSSSCRFYHSFFCVCILSAISHEQFLFWPHLFGALYACVCKMLSFLRRSSFTYSFLRSGLYH